jgi:hypothetical protein
MNLQENITRLKQLMGVLSEQDTNTEVQTKDFSECKKNVETKFTEAKNFIIKWISDSKTKEKFKKNWGVGQDNLIPTEQYRYMNSYAESDNVDDIFNGYLELLKKIQPDFYFTGDDKSLINQIDLNTDNESEKTNRGDAIAFVNKHLSKETVLINCEAFMNQADQLSILIHEIQHLLFYYFPFNPGEKIHNIFNTVDTKAYSETGRIHDTFNRILDGINTKNLMNISQKYGIDKNILEDWFIEVKTKAGNKLPSNKVEITQSPNYFYLYTCNENENMSNIMGLRSDLNISPTENINYQDIIQFIKKEKINVNAKWLIRCWALNGYIDIQKWINNMNLLAINKQSSSGDRNLA